jgi:hypothetical protein
MSNQIKITKENAIAQVQSSVSSIFSKEDVLFLLNAIEQQQQSAPKLTLNQVRDLTHSIVIAIEEEAQRDNIVCCDDVEFDLDYNKRIQVTDVPINFDAIRDCIEEGLTEFFEDADNEDEFETEAREIEQIEQDNRD